jgi:RecB family exonuclease
MLELPSRMARYSPLRFRVFDTCRLRYRYQYLDRVPARLRPQDTAGSLLHRVLCDFFSKVPVEERTGDRLIGLFEAGWDALSPRYLRMEVVERLRESALEQLRLFAQTEDLGAEPFAVEPYFQVEMGPGVTLFGRVDRIDEEEDGSLHLIDYKTGADEKEVDARQLRLYAIMAEESLGKPVTRLSFWYLDSGKTSTVEFTDEDRRKARLELMAAVDEMDQVSEFPANIGRHCDYCPYLYACAERDEIARRQMVEGW